MIGKYKIIAFCTCRIQDGECHELIDELNKRLLPHNFRLSVYNCNSKPGESDFTQSAQGAVFSLIDPTVCDAVVIHSYRFDNHSFCLNLSKHFREMGLPVISLDEKLPGCINIEYKHEYGFAEVVSHLVNYHGYKIFHMIAGTKDNYYSDKRIKAFKMVLESSGLPFDSSMVSYGDFWSMPAINAVQRLIDENRLPQAFVCANDHMAVAVSYYLQSKGFAVPKDIAVAGYDGIETIYSAEPTITSAAISSAAIAELLSETIIELTESGFNEKDISLIPKLITGESCGCKGERKINSAPAYNELVNNFYRYQDENIILSEVVEKIQQCEEINEIPSIMRKHDLMYAMTCIIKKDCLDESKNPQTKTKMSCNDDFLVIYDSDEYDKYVNSGKKFVPYSLKSKQFVPYFELYMDMGRYFITTAIYSSDVPLGYACFHFSDFIPSNFYKIPQTVNMLNNAFGSLRSVRHQNYLIERMDEMSKVDALTGLYNRHGFRLEYEALLNKLDNNRLAVIMCDLDGLKTINDKFGHDDGDFAIKTVAHALKEICPADAVCTRFGGDEMIAVFPFCMSESEIKTAFYNKVAEKSSNSGKPYTISASIGIYFTESGVRPTFEELIKCSDTLMYSEKNRKKKMM
ncbi:MAG: GGDEF domain-containing protein [Ruminiclostridium sp.]